MTIAEMISPSDREIALVRALRQVETLALCGKEALDAEPIYPDVALQQLRNILNTVKRTLT
jgi:hypothetical protein